MQSAEQVDEMSETQTAELKQRLIEALRSVHDPEIPVNIYDLGLIYRLDVDEKGVVEVEMTLTAPACPVAGSPAWTQERMSDEAMLQLGLF